MTRKEKISEIKDMIAQAVADDRILQSCADEIINAYDEIAALELDVPSDETIEKRVEDDYCFNSPLYVLGVKKGMKEMRDEIIKRNKT